MITGILLIIFIDIYAPHTNGIQYLTDLLLELLLYPGDSFLKLPVIGFTKLLTIVGRDVFRVIIVFSVSIKMSDLLVDLLFCRYNSLLELLLMGLLKLSKLVVIIRSSQHNNSRST